jgi:hypothetical protein
MKPRRELEIIRAIVVGAVVILAAVAAAVVFVAPLGIADPAPDLRKDALGLLRDIILIGLTWLAGSQVSRGRQQHPPDETEPT